METLETESSADPWRMRVRVVCALPQRLCEEGAHKGDLKGAWLVISECLPDRTIQVRRDLELLVWEPFIAQPLS